MQQIQSGVMPNIEQMPAMQQILMMDDQDDDEDDYDYDLIDDKI